VLFAGFAVERVGSSPPATLVVAATDTLVELVKSVELFAGLAVEKVGNTPPAKVVVCATIALVERVVLLADFDVVNPLVELLVAWTDPAAETVVPFAGFAVEKVDSAPPTGMLHDVTAELVEEVAAFQVELVALVASPFTELDVVLFAGFAVQLLDKAAKEVVEDVELLEGFALEKVGNTPPAKVVVVAAWLADEAVLLTGFPGKMAEIVVAVLAELMVVLADELVEMLVRSPVKSGAVVNATLAEVLIDVFTVGMVKFVGNELASVDSVASAPPNGDVHAVQLIDPVLGTLLVPKATELAELVGFGTTVVPGRVTLTAKLPTEVVAFVTAFVVALVVFATAPPARVVSFTSAAP
jgi:hypothetical protein